MANHLALLATLLGFIVVAYCELPSQNPALSFIATVDGKSFYADASRRSAKFAEALDFCHEHDLHIATIESQSQNNRISDYGIGQGSAFYWIGATDYFHEGVFYWLRDNRRVTYNNFQRWNTLEFNCAFISSVSGTWFYDSCSRASFRIICETDTVKADNE